MAPGLMTSSPRNRLLSVLSEETLSRLLPRLHTVVLPVRKTLTLPGVPIDAVWFIESGWVSMVVELADGGGAEVGFIGREGLVGTSLAGDVDSCYVESYVQAEATALSMEAKAFQREMEALPELRSLLFRYNEAMYAQTMQTAACNGRHVLEQRLARWLLMAHDRAEDDELPLTQEFLSMMLCVHRPGISLAAKSLRGMGAIRYSRGGITVLDRGMLEGVVCDCYGAVRNRFRQLLD
jgi:CRP-like cAMP-binding protein